MTKTVREFSVAGPCITLGELVRETPASYFVRDRYEPTKINRYGKGRWEGKRHTEACPSCRDHAKTQYPEGYMD